MDIADPPSDKFVCCCVPSDLQFHSLLLDRVFTHFLGRIAWWCSLHKCFLFDLSTSGAQVLGVLFGCY